MKFTHGIWMKFVDWWGINTAIEQQWTSMLYLCGSRLNWMKSKAWLTAAAAVPWHIWLARNHTIFRQEEREAKDVFTQIQVKAHKWITARSNRKICNFDQCCSNPRNFRL
ncbi:hypothetical protein Ancab_040144 [Ancistrocladus abbreviatus]